MGKVVHTYLSFAFLQQSFDKFPVCLRHGSRVHVRQLGLTDTFRTGFLQVFLKTEDRLTYQKRLYNLISLQNVKCEMKPQVTRLALVFIQMQRQLKEGSQENFVRTNHDELATCVRQEKSVSSYFSSIKCYFIFPRRITVRSFKDNTVKHRSIQMYGFTFRSLGAISK